MSQTGFPRSGLYAITAEHLHPEMTLEEAVALAIGGGAKAIQYRDKSEDAARRRVQARALMTVCRRCGVPLVVNDDVALAAEIGADGVHLGRNDASPDAARERLGPRATIGVSCYDRLRRAIDAQRAGASYVAFGSFYPSPTKPDAVRAPLDLLREARAHLRIPVVAIGGITPDNGADLLAAGADVLAVVHGVFAARDPTEAARKYASLFEQQLEGNCS